VRFQAGRIDAMTTNGLDAVDRAGSFVADSVGRPVRQIAGLVQRPKRSSNRCAPRLSLAREVLRRRGPLRLASEPT